MLPNNKMNDKTKIIEYTTKQFFENGFYKISMDQLASGMKISKKTIYKHFSSKSLLVETIVKTFQVKIKDDLYRIIEQGDCLLQLKKLSCYFINLSVKINKRMLNDLLEHKPELWKQIDEFRGEVIKKVWGSIINQGKSQQLIIDVPNEIIIGVVLSALRGIISPTALTENKINITDAFEVTFKIIISGILTEKGRREFEKQNLDMENENI